jgi:ABC-2 type transport system ATP-binding protein
VTAPQTEDAAPPGVVAHGLRRSFGPVEAVRNVAFTARAGEVTGLVGPNGAGKTTALLILATLLVPDAGQARIAGFDPITQTSEVRARMGWTPDVFGLYDTLTAREYLESMAAAYRLDAARQVARARELLAITHLEAYADRPVHVLSRGQKQRLGLARALVHEPDVLLLDEPAAGLDPRSRVELRDLLRSLAADGAAVVVSSHILGDLEELADRVVVIDRGVTVTEQRIADLPRTGTRRWRIRALDLESLLAALARAGVAYDDPTPAGVDVELESDESAAGLLGRLVRAKVAVVAFAPTAGDLEAAYLGLTGEERR